RDSHSQPPSSRPGEFPSRRIPQSHSAAAFACSCVESLVAATAPTSASAGIPPTPGSPSPPRRLLWCCRPEQLPPRKAPHFPYVQFRPRHNLSPPAAAVMPPPDLPDKYSTRPASRLLLS